MIPHAPATATALDVNAIAILDHLLAAKTAFGRCTASVGDLLHVAREPIARYAPVPKHWLERIGITITHAGGLEYVAIARTPAMGRMFSGRKSAVADLCKLIPWSTWLTQLNGSKSAHRVRFGKKSFYAVLVPIELIE